MLEEAEGNGVDKVDSSSSSSSLIAPLSTNYGYLPTGSMNPSPPVHHHQPPSATMDPQKMEVLKQQKAIWEEGIEL